VGDHVIALHDGLIPGTKGNIDHISVAPAGVLVVDAKAYKGKVSNAMSGRCGAPRTRYTSAGGTGLAS
jgi:hypothetical protein